MLLSIFEIFCLFLIPLTFPSNISKRPPRQYCFILCLLPPSPLFIIDLTSVFFVVLLSGYILQKKTVADGYGMIAQLFWAHKSHLQLVPSFFAKCVWLQMNLNPPMDVRLLSDSLDIHLKEISPKKRPSSQNRNEPSTN